MDPFSELEKRLNEKKGDLVTIGKDYLNGKRDAAITSLAEVATGVVSGVPWLGKVASAVVAKVLVEPANEILDKQIAAWKVEEDQQAFSNRVAAAVLDKMLSGLRQLCMEESRGHQQQELDLHDVLLQLTKQNQDLDEKIERIAQRGPEAPVEPAVVFEGPGALPATSVPDFLGRTVEMEELAQALAATPDQAIGVVLSGTGGMGKTTLVRQLVATRGAALFPEGGAWLDGQALTSELARVARRLGWSAKADPTPEEAVTFLDRRLNPRRMLVVVDNLSVSPGSSQRLVPLPGGRCKTLITSRSRQLALDLGGPMRSLHLERWSPEQSRGYLRAVVPRLGQASDRDLDALTTFVGGLPLALRLVARALLRDRERSAAAYLARLQAQPLVTLDRQAGATDRGIAATFQSAYQTLAPEVRTVLLALAACAPSTRSRFVCEVAALDEERVGEALNDLADISLADFCAEAPAPWGMHDIVRLFSRAHPEAQPLAKAHTDWVQGLLRRCADPTSFQLLDEGVSEAVAAFHWCLAQGELDQAMAIANMAGGHLDRRGAFAQAIGLLQALLDRLPPDGVEATRILGNLGRCRAALGDLPQALQLHHRALILAERHGHQGLQAIALGNLGDCLFKMGDPSAALRCHRRSLDLETDPGRRARAMGDVGQCLRTLGQPVLAFVHIAAAVSMAEALQDDPQAREVRAIELGKLADCYRSFGKLTRAIETHQRAIDLNTSIGRQEGVAVQLHQLAQCCELANDLPKAIAHYRQALAINQAISRPLSVIRQLACLGHCQVKLGQSGEARTLLAQAGNVLAALRLPPTHPTVGLLAQLRREIDGG
jgi:tetratricopeptide (TPR) repeat protein